MINNHRVNESYLSKVKVERTLFNIRNLMIMVRLASQDGDIAGDKVDFAIAVHGIARGVEDEINELIQDTLPNCYQHLERPD